MGAGDDRVTADVDPVVLLLSCGAPKDEDHTIW